MLLCGFFLVRVGVSKCACSRMCTCLQQCTDAGVHVRGGVVRGAWCVVRGAGARAWCVGVERGRVVSLRARRRACAT